MNQKDFLYAMKVKGYVVFNNVLRKETVERIEDALSCLPKEAIHNGVVRNLFTKLPVECLHEVMENEVVLPKIDFLLGNTFIYYSFNSSPLYPGVKGPAADFHRDSGRYIPGYDHSFNVLYSVTDFTPMSGVTKVIPGSYILDENPSEAYIAENTSEIQMLAGSAMIFNSNLWHASGTNSGKKVRWGIGLTCKRSFMRQQFDLPRALSPELVNRLSERGRQLLGFYVRMPTSMEEYLLPESERLYKLGQG